MPTPPAAGGSRGILSQAIHFLQSRPALRVPKRSNSFVMNPTLVNLAMAVDYTQHLMADDSPSGMKEGGGCIAAVWHWFLLVG